MRLFISIDFSDEIKNTLTDAIGQLKKQSSSANFTREENLHLTLAFIGETENCDAAVRAMQTIKMKPFDITVGGFGSFGDLWWIGIKTASGDSDLSRLSDRIKKALRSEGFDIDHKKFKPHITIARRVKTNSQTDRIRLNIPSASMTVSGFSLMKSERVNGRLTYTELYWKSLQ